MSTAAVQREVPRTFFHVLGGIFLAIIGYVLQSPTNKIVLGVFLLTSFTVDTARLYSQGFSRLIQPVLGPFIRPSEATKFTGVLAFNGGFFLAFLLFSKHVALASVIPLIVGDRAAVLVGKGFGRIRIGSKTLEGSLACLLVTILAYLFLRKMWPSLLPFGTIILIVAAVVGTLAEMLPRPFNDNLTIPLTVGFFLVVFAG